MANAVVLRKLMEGPRHLTVMAQWVIDTTAEMTDTLIIDPAGSGVGDPVPVIGAVKAFTIEEIWFDLINMSVLLEFDATTDTPAWSMSKETGPYIDFRSIGGIKDASGTGATGKIIATTVGATANTSFGTMILKVRKD